MFLITVTITNCLGITSSTYPVFGKSAAKEWRNEVQDLLLKQGWQDEYRCVFEDAENIPAAYLRKDSDRVEIHGKLATELPAPTDFIAKRLS